MEEWVMNSLYLVLLLSVLLLALTVENLRKRVNSAENKLHEYEVWFEKLDNEADSILEAVKALSFDLAKNHKKS